MAQTTPEEPTLIPPASETDAKPYTPPSKKNHVPAGTWLFFCGRVYGVASVSDAGEMSVGSSGVVWAIGSFLLKSWCNKR